MTFYFTKVIIPRDDVRGPKARAREPSDLNVPITAPFWSTLPYADAMAVKHGITIADPNL